MSKTHLKLPVTGILALLMTGCGLMSSSSVAQVHENALVCENCNYVQAQQLAMQYAVPHLQCHTIGGGDMITIDNQSCTSLPKRVVVFNAQSRQAYPLEVYHSNQGANPYEMPLQTRDYVVHPEIIAMLNIGVDEHAAFMASAMQNAVQAGIAALQATGPGHASELLFAPANLALSAGSCSSDRDAAAFQLAMDSRRIQTLRSHIQAEFHANERTAIGRIKNAFNFNSVQLDALAFGFSKPGFNLGAVLTITPQTRHISVVFNGENDLRFFDNLDAGNFLGIPRVVFNITPRSEGGIQLSVDQEYSSMGGHPLSALTNIANSNTIIELDYCLAERMAQVFNNVELTGPGSPGTGVPEPIPSPGGPGGGTNICTVYLKTGTHPNMVTVGIIRVAC